MVSPTGLDWDTLVRTIDNASHAQHKEINYLRGQIDSLTKEKQTLAEENISKAHQIMRLEEDVWYLEQEGLSKSHQLDTLVDETRDLIETTHTLIDQNEHLNGMVQALEKAAVKAFDHIATLESHDDLLAEEILAEEIHAEEVLAEEITNLVAESNDLIESLMDDELANDPETLSLVNQYRSREETWAKSAAESQKRIESLELRNKILTASNRRLEDQNDELVVLEDYWQDECLRNQDLAVSLIDRNNEMTEEVSTLKGDSKRLAIKDSFLTSEVSILEQMVITHERR
ncbi:MAG: hypothetical protein Q9218_003519 [Villophora microphyllina]